MKILSRHLLRETLGTLLLAVVVCTGVLLVGNLLKQVVALLISGQAGLATVFKAIALLLPYVLTFALPMGMLTASLLVFGRLSADQEITAARANGISLASLALPVLLLSLVFAGLCAWVNLDVGPRSRAAFKRLLHEAAFSQDRPLITEGRFITDLPGIVFYAGRVRGQELEDVVFYQLEDGRRVRDLRAPRARLELDLTNRLLRLTFFDARALEWVPAAPAPPPATNDVPSAANEPPPASPPVEANAPAAAETNAPSAVAPAEGEGQWQPIFLAETTLPTIALPALGGRGHVTQTSDLTFRELRAERERLRALGVPDTTPIGVQMHRQVAFSFASFVFTLVGIPLGVRAHRRETSAGLALAVLLLLTYYAFIIIGQSLEGRPDLHPQWVIWTPNLLFQLAGGWLLWRADRA
ncbi:MAG: LptF/LptG family permease [Limisphaerales bacterium]